MKKYLIAALVPLLLAACSTYRVQMDFDGRADVATTTDGYVVVDAEGKGRILIQVKESGGWITAVAKGVPLDYAVDGKFRKAWLRQGGFSLKFDEVPVDEALIAMGLPTDWPEGSAHLPGDGARDAPVRVLFVPSP